ncbi:MAG: type II toxin-antitoxin system VapC family toxin [Thermoleophilaceae bacterium]
MSATTAYVDASAAVKLLRPEPETAALRTALAATAIHVSSELLEVELRCVAHREGGGELIERADRICAAIHLLPYTLAIRARGGDVFAPPQRALDALHLATALDLSLQALVFVTYDQRQAQGARAAGLEVVGPA